MALLCTLHADGPRTLRILREAGCTSIGQLGELAPERVGKLLGLPVAAARRLTREARHLVERLEPDLEQEEVTYPPAMEARAVKPPPHSFRLEDAGPAAGPVAGGDARERLDLRDRALLERVVERWRHEDHTAPVPAAEVHGADEGLAQVEIRAGEISEVDPDGARAPRPLRRPEAPARPPGLASQRLAWLDARAAAALEAAGVRTLEELATCPVDELRERSGLGHSLVRRLQFQAGRHLLAAPAAGPEPDEERERLSPTDRPVEALEAAPSFGVDYERLDDGGPAGPFA